MASPTPKTNHTKLINFIEAISEILDGRRVTKLDWGSTDEYAYLKDDFLTIHTKGKDNQWILRNVDMIGEDYVVLPDLN